MTFNKCVGATSPSHHKHNNCRSLMFLHQHTLNSIPDHIIQSYFNQTHIYIAKVKNDWHCKQEKHQILRVTAEKEEQKTTLICDYSKDRKGGQLDSYKTKVNTHLHSWGPFGDQGSRRLKFLLVLWYVRTSRPTPNPIPTHTPRPIPTPTRTPALNHESSPSSPSKKSCLEYKLL